MSNFILHKSSNGLSYLLDDNDLISTAIVLTDFWEKELVEIYERLIDKDFVIIDAGANIGAHSVMFAKLGNIVHSYEPVKDVYYHLCSNILINGYTEKIIPYQLALSDKEENIGIIHEEAINLWSNALKKEITSNRGGTSLGNSDNNNIKAVRLDSFNLNPDLIKIDVEGYEYNLLRGSLKTIKENLPIILIELHSEEHSETSKMSKELLQLLGYEIYSLGIPPYNADYIAVHKSSRHYDKVSNVLGL